MAYSPAHQQQQEQQQKKKKTNKKNKEEKNQTKQQDYAQLKCNQNNLTYSHHGWPPW
jgi:hypothetical protein